MEPQPETAFVLVCGAATPVTAEELELAGLQVKGPEAFSALSRLVNLRTITLAAATRGQRRASSGLRALEPNWY